LGVMSAGRGSGLRGIVYIETVSQRTRERHIYMHNFIFLTL